MSITIKEIAKLANTSRGTVDRVINKRGGVRKELEDKINSIIEEHQYQINAYGRGLVSLSKKYKIGLIINSIGNEFFDLVLYGVEKAIKKYSNISLIVKELKGYDEDIFIENVNKIMKNDLDLLIVTPINTNKITNLIGELNIPVIAVNNELEVDDVAFVGCNYINSGNISGDLANLLIEKDSNILVVGGSFKLIGHRQRVEGFKESLSQSKYNHEFIVIENEDDDKISYDLVKEKIEQNKIDLVYFCAAGIKGGLQAIEEAQIKPFIITVDETKTVVNHLRQGKIAATITQQPYKQGSLAIELAANHLIYGKPIKGVKEITGNNVKLKHSYFGYSLLDR